MPIRDSRRLTGPSLLLPSAGALLEVECEDVPALSARWRVALDQALVALGWTAAQVATRVVAGGALLAFTAPIDALYVATEVNEWAWNATEAGLSDEALLASLETALPALLASIVRESNPALLALEAAAKNAGVSLLADEDLVSVGLGTGSRSWSTRALPLATSIDWSNVTDIPVGLVTGTNGKTTTVRLAAAMLRASDRVVGLTSTDGVVVQDRWLDRGDFSGPGGARLALRDREVEVAVLETARGGILRRGLAVSRADAALVTNVAEDHLGEFGLSTVRELLESKLVVASVVPLEGAVILNADDPFIVAEGPSILDERGVLAPIVWFSARDENPVVRGHLEAGGEACFVDEGSICWCREGEHVRLVAVDEAPITWHGAARYNLSNALGATALALRLGASVDAVRQTLRHFAGTIAENPGRGNRIDLAGVSLLIDFAHNPHGWRALVELVRTIPARRRAVLLGQAGDRDDAAIRELARIAWTLEPAHIVLKELTSYLRGRAAGVVPAILEEELLRLGAAPSSIVHVQTELAALDEVLAWAEEGDLLVLPIHAERDEVMLRLQELTRSGWRPKPAASGA